MYTFLSISEKCIRIKILRKIFIGEDIQSLLKNRATNDHAYF